MLETEPTTSETCCATHFAIRTLGNSDKYLWNHENLAYDNDSSPNRT